MTQTIQFQRPLIQLSGSILHCYWRFPNSL